MDQNVKNILHETILHWLKKHWTGSVCHWYFFSYVYIAKLHGIDVLHVKINSRLPVVARLYKVAQINSNI